MGKEKCWKCKRLRSDVNIRACEERLCVPCSDYNDKCLQYKVFPRWDLIEKGQYPDIPGTHVSALANNEPQDNNSNITFAANLHVNIPEENSASDIPENNRARNCILNPLLAYTVYGLLSGTVSNVNIAVLGYFTPEQIIEAKNTLWDNCDSDILGTKPPRREGSITPKAEANMADIVKAIQKLDSVGQLPEIGLTALDLGCIPRSHPEELNNIRLVDRLGKLEQKLTGFQEILDRTVCENMNIKDKLLYLKPTYSSVVTNNTNSTPNDGSMPAGTPDSSSDRFTHPHHGGTRPKDTNFTSQQRSRTDYSKAGSSLVALDLQQCRKREVVLRIQLIVSYICLQ